MNELTTIFVLLIVFQLKHFMADFPLQNSYMLGKFNKKGWMLPLAAHCTVHGALTFGILMALTPQLWTLALADFVIHFIVDKIKASTNIDIEKPEFWWLLGLDQMMHHLTHYLFIWIIIYHKFPL